MNVKNVSKRIYELEAVRGFAALYVFLTHLFGKNDILLLKFGQEAVMLFFVLSGFVIYYSTFSNGYMQEFNVYFVHRFKRIYPQFLAALFLSFICYIIVGAIKYDILECVYLFGNLFMLQDNESLKRGVWFPVFCGNSALWSLSYEWWFYMVFYCNIYFIQNKKNQTIFAFTLTILSIVIYQLVPNQISLILGYYYLWWSGVELSREYMQSKKITFFGQIFNILFLSFVCLMWFIPVVYSWYLGDVLRFGVDPVLQFRHSFSVIFLIIIMFFWYKAGLPLFKYSIGPFAFVAPISYGLYIYHVPFISVFELYSQDINIFVRVFFIATCSFATAIFMEIYFQKFINKLFSKVFKIT